MLRRWLALCEVVFRTQRDYLTQLDAAIGDADHGANMDRSFTAIEGAVGALPADAPPASVLSASGETLVAAIGGASGALWGTALRRAGAALCDDPEPDARRFAAALEAARDGIVELGVAEVGDKTMVDALAPALVALNAALDRGEPLAEAMRNASAAADEGARATIPMQASKGRAAYLGERSVGHQDPGATSTALILRALSDAVDGH